MGYEVTPTVMRGTLRMAAGTMTRRELRALMFRAGYYEPYVSSYLDMVQKCMRRLKENA